MPTGPALRRTLGRTERLKQGRDFLRLKQTGRRAVNGCLIANWQELPTGTTARVGVVVSRKVGNAVHRSRARRLLRETFRLHRAELAQPVDLVLVARPSIANKALGDVEKDFLSTLRRAGLLKEMPAPSQSGTVASSSEP
jgi:ribonuclease P protein component